MFPGSPGVLKINAIELTFSLYVPPLLLILSNDIDDDENGEKIWLNLKHKQEHETTTRLQSQSRPRHQQQDPKLSGRDKFVDGSLRRLEELGTKRLESCQRLEIDNIGINERDSSGDSNDIKRRTDRAEAEVGSRKLDGQTLGKRQPNSIPISSKSPANADTQATDTSLATTLTSRGQASNFVHYPSATTTTTTQASTTTTVASKARRKRREANGIAIWPLGKQAISHLVIGQQQAAGASHVDRNSKRNTHINNNTNDSLGGSRETPIATTRSPKGCCRLLSYGDCEDILGPHLASFSRLEESPDSARPKSSASNHKEETKIPSLTSYYRQRRHFGEPFEWPTAGWIYNATKPEKINLNSKMPATFKGEFKRSASFIMGFSWAEPIMIGRAQLDRASPSSPFSRFLSGSSCCPPGSIRAQMRRNDCWRRRQKNPLTKAWKDLTSWTRVELRSFLPLDRLSFTRPVKFIHFVAVALIWSATRAGNIDESKYNWSRQRLAASKEARGGNLEETNSIASPWLLSALWP